MNKKTIRRKTIPEVERRALELTPEGWKKVSSTLTGWTPFRGKFYYIILEKNATED
jgi:hypothetical protein